MSHEDQSEAWIVIGQGQQLLMLNRRMFSHCYGYVMWPYPSITDIQLGTSRPSYQWDHHSEVCEKFTELGDESLG